MAQYQIVPYTIKVSVVGATQETRPLHDLDARGLSLLDFIAETARAHKGQPRREKADSDTSLQIDRVWRGGDVALVEAAGGVTGIRARLRHSGVEDVTQVKEQDWTETPLRTIFYIPQGHHVGVFLVERVGSAGVLTRLSAMLNASLRSKCSGKLRLEIAPAMTEEAMSRWAEDAVVKTLVLQHSNVATGESSRKIKGLPFGRVLEFRAPRNRSWPLASFGGLDKATQLGILTELAPALPGGASDRADQVAQQMLDEGWTVSIGLKKDGHIRRMQVDTKSGITITFPASAAGKITSRPDDPDFRGACQMALEELRGDGINCGSPKGCTWDETPWEPDGDPWKAVWGVL